MTNVFVDCARVGGSIRCPGDEGFSEVVVFGRHARLRKDHPAIEVMGRLDELEALAEWGAQEVGGDVFSLVAALATALNTYLATGNEKWLKPVDEAVNRACKIDVKELGWFTPSSKATALLNLLRVKAREAERAVVRLADDETLPRDKAQALTKALNQLNKLIAHLIYVSEPHVYKSVEEKINKLLKK